MPLQAGTRLGPFEILEPIGAGGMGEVYKARDVRLNRVVAVKTLLEPFATRPDARARFEREAKVIAGLNHPHICTIHDVGHSNGIDFLVLELLDGETLAERLARGPLPAHEAIQYAVDIADALDKAHSQGISHRDLKPGNIMITSSGVKLLDFGLSIARPPAEAHGIGATFTNAAPLTAEGTILGTLQYMAPEQLEGGPADHRSDIFAFGAVLHEMLTGRKAFAGATRMSLASAIVRDTPPPVSTLLVDGSADHRLNTTDVRMLDRLIATCLAKNPENRWQATRDLWRELTWIAQGADSKPDDSAVPGAAGARLRVPLWLAVTAAVIVGLLAGVAAWITTSGNHGAAAPSQVVRASFGLPRGEELIMGALALSPDGALLSYVSVQKGGLRQLHVREMATGIMTDMPGSEGAFAPFFSPDGRWIGFFADGKLKRALASGGAPEKLCEVASPMGGTWGPADTIYFAPFNTSGVWSVSSTGGTPKAVTTLNRAKGETSHRWPHVLPGGTALLFTIWNGPGWDEHELHVLDLRSGQRRMILKGGTSGDYVSSGHIVYSRADVMMAVPFDLSRLEITGSPVALSERVLEEDGSEFAVSTAGLLAYQAVSPQRSQRQLAWVDSKGRIDVVPASPRPFTDPAVSPDGRFAAVSVQGPVQTVWIYDFSRRTLTPLTSASSGSSQAPVWTPNGKRIAYRGTRAGFRNLFWKSADGSDEEDRLTTTENLQTPSSWSSDGQSLVYIEVAPDTGADIFTLPVEGRTPRVFLRTPVTERSPAVSPDGRWLAYSSTESGVEEVYLRPFRDGGAKLQVSTEGGVEPAWLPDGHQLFYRSKDNIMKATILTQPTLSAGIPTVAFAGRFKASDTGGTPGYGVVPDGRLLIVQPLEPDQPATVVTLVTNWFEEVRRLSRADRP